MRGTGRPVTRSRLAGDLRRLGLQPGDAVELHVSLRAVGWVVGGPDVLIQALLDVLSPTGTLMMACSWIDGTYGMEEWPPEWRQAYLEECPAFDPASSRADHRELSIVAECLRTWPGARRSSHPDFSVCAVGAKAEWLTADHPWQYGYGPGSPLAKLYEIGGNVLVLGASLDTITLLHYAEHLADIVGKRVVRYRMPVLEAGQRVWCEIEEFDTSSGVVAGMPENCFELIARDYLAAGEGRAGEVGNAAAYLFDARPLVDFAVGWLEREYGSRQGAAG
jgi:aminoglycoside 3-N-acetyltransferase